MKNDRRNFLKTVGGGTAAAAAVSTLAQNGAQAQEVIIDPKLPPIRPTQQLSLARQGEQIKFALQLDGAFAGWLSSAEGGYAYGEVVTEKFGADGITRKHIGAVKYEDITVTCGTGMSKAFYDWIKASLEYKYQRKDGAIVTADFKYESLTTLKFFNALLTEVTLPALDASSKDAAKMTLKFSPEYTQMNKASGKISGEVAPKNQKSWLPSNFRLRIDGLDEACQKVNKIEALTIKQKVTENAVGEIRDYEREPGKLEFPDLKITLSEQFSSEVHKWHEDFVIKGNNGQDSERGGTLEYLTPDNANTLFTLTFKNLGIFKLTPDKAEAPSECCKQASGQTTQSDLSSIRRVKAEMYCEELTFQYGAKSA